MGATGQEELEHARVRVSYWEEEQRGTAMSVHERYQATLRELERKLRGARHRTPLGEILVQMGALSREELERALTELEEEEEEEEHKPLLGEALVDRGLVEPPTILRAVEIQVGVGAGTHPDAQHNQPRSQG